MLLILWCVKPIIPDKFSKKFSLEQFRYRSYNRVMTMSHVAQRLKLFVPMFLALIAVLAIVAEIVQGDNDDSRPIFVEKNATFEPADPAVVQELREKYSMGIQDSIAFQAEWLEGFLQNGTDPKSLEWKPFTGQAGDPGGNSLEESLRRADVVVHGTAQAAEFWPGQTIVTFAVITRVKGSDIESGDEIRVAFPGGPTYEPASKEGVVGYVPALPLLLPGDEAILVLQQADSSNGEVELTYYPQTWTGIYKVVSQRVEAVEGNIFGGQDVHGRSVSDAIRVLEEASR